MCVCVDGLMGDAGGDGDAGDGDGDGGDGDADAGGDGSRRGPSISHLWLKQRLRRATPHCYPLRRDPHNLLWPPSRSTHRTSASCLSQALASKSRWRAACFFTGKRS